jgi:hypothetical protein
MALVPPATLQEWAASHAARAHELLSAVDVALAALPAKKLDALVALDQQRIALAEAHAQASLALSSTIVPSVTPPAAG